jgi:hypothetical protein
MGVVLTLSIRLRVGYSREYGDLNGTLSYRPVGEAG